MNKLLYFIGVIILLVAGCTGNRNVNRQLSAAESLIVESPDSAVRILSEMDTAAMSEAQKARQQLLYAYISVIYANPVSLNTAAVEWGDSVFGGNFDSDEIKWLIVKSADAKQKGDIIARIESLKDAEFLAIRLDEKFDLAIIYQYLASVYEQGFNGTVSKYYAEKEPAFSASLNCPKQLREARMAIAGAYAAKRDYKSMLDSLLAMKDEVMANATDGYKVYFLDQLARSYDEDGQTGKAIEIFHTLYDGKEVSANTLAHWARAYSRVGKLDSAYMLIQRANVMPHNSSDEYLCRNVEYDILEKMGRKRELAGVDSLRSLAYAKTMDERKLEESTLVLNKKYDSVTRKAWVETAEARTRTGIAVFIAVLSVVIAAGIFIYLRKRNQLLRLEHENDVLKMRALQSNLFETDNRNKDMATRISELFQTRFRLLDNLASSYFECRETGSEQKRIYAEVRQALGNFSSASATHELEDVVNGYNDNLMARFREDYPKLSAAQYRLALYLFCGFSLPSISIFTGSDLRNIYVYKSRLKGIISKGETPRKEEYLSYFG